MYAEIKGEVELLKKELKNSEIRADKSANDEQELEDQRTSSTT